MHDLIGDRGELLFRLNIATIEAGWSAARFRPAFLGEKWPNIDFYVELVNPPAGIRPYFLAQVKTTQRPYTRSQGRLPVQLDAAEAQALAAYPAPVYLIGVNETDRRCFIASARGKTVGLSSLTAAHELDGVTRGILWSEVLTYWRSVGTPPGASAFDDPRWS